MTAKTLREYFEKNWLLYQVHQGRATQDDYAIYLGISHSYLTQLMNGNKNNIGKKTAYRICEKNEDYTLCDILGYSRPGIQVVSVDSLPSDIRDKLVSALTELDSIIRTREIQPDSPEGVALSTSVLQKFGFNITVNDKSG
ncbi:MAG: hypothetical protein ABFD14_01300 [Anaerolineaceae bacterium]